MTMKINDQKWEMTANDIANFPFDYCSCIMIPVSSAKLKGIKQSADNAGKSSPFIFPFMVRF